MRRGAWANRLDKTACADLSAEVSSLLASGLKEDMDKGPAWGAANLSLERLVAINRVIDLQGQLEFRCGSGKVAKSLAETPSPDQATTSKTSTAKSSREAAGKMPSLPSQKANPVRGKRGSAAKSLELSPVAPATAAPVAASHAPASPAPPSPTPNSPPLGERTAATSPSAASPPQLATVAPTSTAPKAAADTSKPATTPATIPPPAPTDAAAIPAVQKSAARKKSSRRDGSTYVSPKEANPFSLLLGN